MKKTFFIALIVLFTFVVLRLGVALANSGAELATTDNAMSHDLPIALANPLGNLPTDIQHTSMSGSSTGDWVLPSGPAPTLQIDRLEPVTTMGARVEGISADELDDLGISSTGQPFELMMPVETAAGARFFTGCYSQTGWLQIASNTGVVYDCELLPVPPTIFGPSPTTVDDALDGFYFEFPPGWTVTAINSAPPPSQDGNAANCTGGVFPPAGYSYFQAIDPFGAAPNSVFFGLFDGANLPPFSARSGCGPFWDDGTAPRLQFQVVADIPADRVSPQPAPLTAPYPGDCPGSVNFAIDDGWLFANRENNTIRAIFGPGAIGFVAGFGVGDGRISGGTEFFFMQYNTGCPEPIVEIHKGTLGGPFGSTCMLPDDATYMNYQHGDFNVLEVLPGDNVDYCYVIDNVSADYDTPVTVFVDVNGNMNFDGCDFGAGEDFCLFSYNTAAPRRVSVTNHNVLDDIVGDIDSNGAGGIITTDQITYDPADPFSPNANPTYRVEVDSFPAPSATCVESNVFNTAVYSTTTAAGYGRQQFSSTTIFGTYNYIGQDESLNASFPDVNAEDSANVRVRSVDLGITKTAPISVTSGDTFNYTLLVSNGLGHGTDVTTTDSIDPLLSPAGDCTVTYVDYPNALTIGAASCNQNDANNGEPGVTCTFDTSAVAGETVGVVDFDFAYTTPRNDPPILYSNLSYMNEVEATLTSDAGSNFGPLFCNDKSGDCTMSFDRDTLFFGEAVGNTWTFTLVDAFGDEVDPEHLLDPARLSLTIYPIDTDTATFAPLNDTRFLAGYANPGIIYSCPVTADPSETVVCRDQDVNNTADAMTGFTDADVCDAAATSNTTTTTIVGLEAGFEVDKVETSTPANPPNYAIGEGITFDIMITNTGDIDLNNLMLTDVWDSSCMTCVDPSGSLPSLAAGNSTTIAVSCTATASSSNCNNTATVVDTALQSDAGSWTNSACNFEDTSGDGVPTPVQLQRVDAMASVNIQLIMLLAVALVLALATLTFWRRQQS